MTESVLIRAQKLDPREEGLLNFVNEPSRPKNLSSNTTKTNADKNNNYGDSSSKDSMSQNPGEIHRLLTYPQGKGGISINTEDYLCLATDQYLNDVIIDFYLNYLREEVLSGPQREQSHFFSTFFYERLTSTPRQKTAPSDSKLPAGLKQHERVKTWTKNVNLFEKEFIIVPINDKSHWFLAIICFPGLIRPASYDTGGKIKNQYNSIDLCDDTTEGEAIELVLSDSDSSFKQPVTEEGGAKKPCILIFNSLVGESPPSVTTTLRDYLTCEYNAKVLPNSTHTFNKHNMPGYNVKVPQQNNMTDCGLYLLQYVEEFFTHPIADFKPPAVRSLQNWFENWLVVRKREEIASLIQELMTKYNPSYTHRLPNIPFPTRYGRLLERETDVEVVDCEEVEFIGDDSRDRRTSRRLRRNRISS